MKKLKMQYLKKLLTLPILMFSILIVWGVPGCRSGEAVVPDDANDVQPLLPGMKAPAFMVTDAGGKPYQFDPERLNRRTIVTFYRGGWCPYCNRYLSELRLAEPDLLDMGYDLLFLSADRHEVLAEALEESEYKHTVLSDNNLAAARAFGVAFRLSDDLHEKYIEKGVDLEGASGKDHHMLPVPAMFLIGTDGVIRFQYVNPNFQVRLDPRVLLEAAGSVYREENGKK